MSWWRSDVIGLTLILLVLGLSFCEDNKPGEDVYRVESAVRVVNAVTGNSLLIDYGSGPPRTLIVAGIVAPIIGMHSNELVDASTASLLAAAGPHVRVMTAESAQGKYQYGVVGQQGCLQAVQLRAGLAWIDPIYGEVYPIPRQWKDAEDDAKRNRRGIWQLEIMQ